MVQRAAAQVEKEEVTGVQVVHLEAPAVELAERAGTRCKSEGNTPWHQLLCSGLCSMS